MQGCLCLVFIGDLQTVINAQAVQRIVCLCYALLSFSALSAFSLRC